MVTSLPLVLSFALAASPAKAEKNALTFSPTDAEDERPQVTAIRLATVGSDYVLTVDFNKAPYGDECKNRCANATVFVDTDNNKDTGLKLKEATEAGADLAITLQGTRAFRDETSAATLKVMIKQFTEEATALDQGEALAEFTVTQDPERVTLSGHSVKVLIDANLGNQPSGPKMRLVYHPPMNKAAAAVLPGLLARGAGQVELFRGNKLVNQPKSPKK